MSFEVISQDDKTDGAGSGGNIQYYSFCQQTPWIDWNNNELMLLSYLCIQSLIYVLLGATELQCFLKTAKNTLREPQLNWPTWTWALWFIFQPCISKQISGLKLVCLKLQYPVVLGNDFAFVKNQITLLWPVFKDLHLQKVETSGHGVQSNTQGMEVKRAGDRLMQCWFWSFQGICIQKTRLIFK